MLVMELAGVWAGMVLKMAVRAVLLMLRFRGGAWKRIEV
jgi:Na+-driven multidrug efflux pump